MSGKARIGRPPPARRKRVPPRPTYRPRRDGRPELHLQEILAWADAHYQRTGRWPIASSGRIPESPWDKWRDVDRALRRGMRGFRPGSSLPLLLLQYRGVQPRVGKPPLTLAQILRWADAYHARTGQWPGQKTREPVAPGRYETWSVIDQVLQNGRRGLPRGESLPKIFARYRGVPYRGRDQNARDGWNAPRLTIRQILAWADAHYRRHGRYPMLRSGPIDEAPGETWNAVERALLDGTRGLPGGSSLSRLLMKYGRRAYHDWGRHGIRRDRLSIPQILAWADDFHRAHGSWPMKGSGPIPGANHESWHTVNLALQVGLRGMSGGSSLARFLWKHGRLSVDDFRQYHLPRPPLTRKRILAWAEEFHRQTGRWPTARSGTIPESGGETWSSVGTALREGLRGLPGGSSLPLLLAEYGRKPHRQVGQSPGPTSASAGVPASKIRSTRARGRPKKDSSGG